MYSLIYYALLNIRKMTQNMFPMFICSSEDDTSFSLDHSRLQDVNVEKENERQKKN